MYCVIITSTYSINIDQFFWYMISLLHLKMRKNTTKGFGCILPCDMNIQLQYRAGVEVLLDYLASRWKNRSIKLPDHFHSQRQEYVSECGKQTRSNIFSQRQSKQTS